MNRIWQFLLDDKKGARFSTWAMLLFGSVILMHQVWLKFFEVRKYTHAPSGYTSFVEKQILQRGEGDLIQGEFLVGSGRKIEADDTPIEPGGRETADLEDPDLIDAGESNEGLLEAQDLVDLRLNEALLARASPMLQAFVAHSYLRGDLAFPANFRYKFAEGGNKLAITGLRDNVHRRYLPFSESLRYQGDILFRQDTPQVVLRDNTKSRYTLKAGEGAKIIDMMPGNSREDFAAQEIDLRLGGEQIAVLKPVGDELVLRVARNAGGLCDVRLNGQKLAPDTVRRVEPSDILFMEFSVKKGTRADYYLVVEEVREGVISTIRLTDQGRTRIPEQELVPGLSHGLEGALDSIVLQLAAKAPDSAKFLQDLNLRLSLVEPLQRAVQESLVTYARKLDGIDAKVKEPFRKLGEFRAPPLRAAVTVMDVITGEVLALGSYPDEKTLDDLLAGLDKKASDAAAKPDGELLQRAILLRRSEIERLRGTLLSNQNFPLHQIGSIFKPIFSLSVFATFPELVSLRIPSHGENDNRLLLGYDMGKFSDHSHGTTTSSSFIANSCQRYMEYLGLFSLGRREGGLWVGLKEGGNEVNINGKGYSGVLQPSCEKGQCLLWQKDAETLVSKQYTEIRNLEKAPVSRDLERRYGIALTRWNTDSLPEEELYDTTPWRDLISTLQPLIPEDDNAINVSAYFTGLSPVKVVSYLEDFRALYRDFTQYLKGSGLNVWSNITVAQSIARLITGREVSAWMGRMEDPLLPPAPEVCAGGVKPVGAFARCPARALPAVPSEALAAVLQGMADVTAEGTATRLKADVDKATRALKKIYPDETFMFYSKTGSVRRPWSMRLLLVDKQKERQSKVCPGKGGPACPSWLRDPDRDSLPGANYVFALVGGPDGGAVTRGVVVMVYIADAGGSQIATQYVKEAKLIEQLANYLRGEANGQ